MPTKKIADLPVSETCTSPDHSPPKHVSWEPGVYQHTCSECGTSAAFTVPGIRRGQYRAMTARIPRDFNKNWG